MPGWLRCPRTVGACLVILGALLCVPRAAEGRQPDGFWDKSFRSWAAQDKKRPPAKGGVVFVGSSSIRMWPTASSFRRLAILNRGLGGAHIDDIQRFVDRLVLAYEPKVVVFYAGENDIGAGATPGRVLRDYRTFVGQVHARLPQTRIVFLSIKPSVLLRRAWPRAREANRLVEEFCATDPRLRYVDVATPMLGPSGRPRRELFRDDGLHMNERGYELWTRIVAPVVEQELARR